MPKQLFSFKPPTKRSRDESDSEDHGQATSSVKKSAKTEPVKNPVIKSEMPDGIEAFHQGLDPDLDAMLSSITDCNRGSISVENLPSPVKKSAKVKTEPAKSPVKKSAKAKPAEITVKKSAKDEPKKKPAKAGGSWKPDDSGDPSWSLGNMRWAKVQQWKGQAYVNIREYYIDKKSMETKPGKKGTSLSVEQYQKLKEIIPEIDSNLPKKKKPAKAGGSADASNDGSDEPSWSFGNMKRARVNQFNGKTYVDLREFYVDKSTEETKPGKKGISLNVEEYQKLKEIIPEIDSNLG